MLKKLALFSWLLTANMYPNSNHQHLILFQSPSLRFYNNDAIVLKKNSFQKLVSTWQHRLDATWSTISNKIYNETNLTPEQLDNLLTDSDLLTIYSKVNDQGLKRTNSIITEEEADPEIIAFIKKTIHKYCSKRNITILLTPYLPTITATFGTDQTGHYLICNSEAYSLENINHVYKSLTEEHGIFIFKPSVSNKKLNVIELSNLLLIGLIESASHMEHQSNLFTFLLSNFKFPDHKVPLPVVKHVAQFFDLRGQLEAIVQSKNPLEAALFIAQTKKMKKNEYETWKKIIQEVANCYHPTSLIKFKHLLHALVDDPEM